MEFIQITPLMNTLSSDLRVCLLQIGSALLFAFNIYQYGTEALQLNFSMEAEVVESAA
jgi:hypothetical protein